MLSSASALETASKIRNLLHVVHTENVSDLAKRKDLYFRLATLQNSLVAAQKAHEVKVAELSQVFEVCRVANVKVFGSSVDNHVFAWVIGVPVIPSSTQAVGEPPRLVKWFVIGEHFF